MHFIVLSTSDIKKAAVTEWQKDVEFIEVIDTSRPEQPIAKSIAEKHRLVRMRLDKYLATNPDCYDYVLSIENMILLKDETYSDHCVCCLFETRSSVYSYATSDGVNIPDEYMTKFFNEKDSNITVGKIIAAALPGVSHNDWFKAVGSKFYRKTQILNALEQFNNELASKSVNQELLRSEIVYVKDFPKPGIMFKHVLPLFAKLDTRNALKTLIEQLGMQPDFVLGVESRGFILGEMVANITNSGFIAARKPGKLPVEVFEESYEKEYGSDKICIEKCDLTDKVVLIVDDLLATGNTALAAVRLARRCGAIVNHIMCITSVPELLPKARRMLHEHEINIILLVS